MSIEDYPRILVFDSDQRLDFYPLSLTRPSYDFFCGTMTLLQSIEFVLDRSVSDLIVPEYLKPITREQYPKKNVNEQISERCLAINALLRPDYPLVSEIIKASRKNRSNFAVIDENRRVIFAVMEDINPETFPKRLSSSLKRITFSEQTENPPIFRFPWEIVSASGTIIQRQGRQVKNLERNLGPSREGSFEVLGRKLRVSESAAIERFVTFDTRDGYVIVDDGSVIESHSHITGPAYIGKSTRIKSARIRKGTAIASHCQLSGEIEESIIFDYTNKNHDGFIGHSILGSWINLGAMTSNSDLKNTYGRIRLSVRKHEPMNTGLTKVGCFLGDMTKSAIGTMIGSGKTVGVSSQVFGTVLEDVPSFTMYAKSLGAKSAEFYRESAVETQKRMMERRGLKMSKKYEELIRFVFKMTEKDRKSALVKRGKFLL